MFSEMWATALVVALILVTEVHGLIVDVAREGSECFLLGVDKADTVVAQFELLNEVPGDPLMVTIGMEGAAQSKDSSFIYSSKGKADGEVVFDAEEDGMVEMCIYNGYGKIDDKKERSIGFALRLEGLGDIFEGMNDRNAAGGADGLEVDKLIEASQDLAEALNAMVDHQSSHPLPATASFNDRLLTWTVIEAVVLVCLALWQVNYIRQFFEITRML
ncbi:unnamed protein product [Chrysoparadoxa australica]